MELAAFLESLLWYIVEQYKQFNLCECVHNFI